MYPKTADFKSILPAQSHAQCVCSQHCSIMCLNICLNCMEPSVLLVPTTSEPSIYQSPKYKVHITSQGHTYNITSGCKQQTNNLQQCWEVTKILNVYTCKALRTIPYDRKYWLNILILVLYSWQQFEEIWMIPNASVHINRTPAAPATHCPRKVRSASTYWLSTNFYSLEIVYSRRDYSNGSEKATFCSLLGTH